MVFAARMVMIDATPIIVLLFRFAESRSGTRLNLIFSTLLCDSTIPVADDPQKDRRAS